MEANSIRKTVFLPSKLYLGDRYGTDNGIGQPQIRFVDRLRA